VDLYHLSSGVGLYQLPWGALGQDAPLVEDDEAVTQLFGLLHVMGGEEHGDALAL